jgi:hypothetical protein
MRAGASQHGKGARGAVRRHVATGANRRGLDGVGAGRKEGGRGGPSGDGVTTAPSSEVSMAWARGNNDNDGENDNYRSGDAAGAMGCAMGVAEINDNYGGGDDNYPRVGMKMVAERWRKDVAGTGRNSCR